MKKEWNDIHPNDCINNHDENWVKEGHDSKTKNKLRPYIREGAHDALQEPREDDQNREEDDVAERTNENDARVFDGRKQGRLVVQGHSIGQKDESEGRIKVRFTKKVREGKIEGNFLKTN